MKKPFALILGFIVGFIIGGLVVYVHVSASFGKNIRAMLEASDGSQEFYLANRFSDAFQNEPVDVAIWEGTNFVSFLKENWVSPFSLEQRASLCTIHARLSELFGEAGLTQKAKAEADQTLKWVQSITNMSVTSSDAVSNILNHSQVKRQVSSQRTISAE